MSWKIYGRNYASLSCPFCRIYTPRVQRRMRLSRGAALLNDTVAEEVGERNRHLYRNSDLSSALQPSAMLLCTNRRHRLQISWYGYGLAGEIILLVWGWPSVGVRLAFVKRLKNNHNCDSMCCAHISRSFLQKKLGSRLQRQDRHVPR